MALDAQSLRRRAALAALRPVLDDQALLDALWDLQDHMRGDAVSDVIAYVDRVAKRHMLDARVTKRLYEGIFAALRNPDNVSLPDDPWPAMQKRRPQPPAAAPAAAPVYAPRAAAPAPAPVRMPVPAPAPIPVPPPPPPVVAPVPPPPAPPAQAPAPAVPSVPLPAEQLVFASLIQAILTEVQQFHSAALADIRVDSLKALGTLRIPAPLKQQFQQSWLRPLQDNWYLAGTGAELAELTHLVYVGLCEAIGPVDADQVLSRAVRMAERLPEARTFSPRRLL